MKWLIIVYVVFLILVVLGACIGVAILTWRPSLDVMIKNQSAQYLTIYENGVVSSNISPGQSIITDMGGLLHYGPVTIIALNAEGEVVFAKRFTFDTIINLDDRTTKGIILTDIPRRGVPYVDLIVGNKSDMVLTITVEGKVIGEASPGESVTASNLSSPYFPEHEEIVEAPYVYKEPSYYVVATNTQGEEVIRESLKFSKLEIIDYKTLKAIIEPFYKEITFQNKSNSVLTIFINFYEVGKIKPGEIVSMSVPLYADIVQIKAKDAQGETVYSVYRSNVSWEYRDKKWEEVITSYRDQ